MAARKLHYYISNADTTIRSDHMPLRKFLLKNTKNATVNNWAVAIEDYNLKFEYIKGIKNTLADTMSRLVQLDPDTALPPEPDHEEFGKPKGRGQAGSGSIHALSPDTPRKPEQKGDGDPFKDTVLPTWGFKDEDVKESQEGDGLCQKMFQQAAKNGEKAIHPYYVERGILMKYVSDNKQRFKVVVVPPGWGPMLLKLAHDDLGHNGTAVYLHDPQEELLLEGYESFCGLVCKAVCSVPGAQCHGHLICERIF